MKNTNRDLMKGGQLPSVSIIALSDDDAEAREEFSRYVDGLSVARCNVVYSHELTLDVLGNIEDDYVAIVRTNDRYVNDYALELLVNTAKYEGADIVGGIGKNELVVVSNFVFSTVWLQDNGDLLDLLVNDDQAFMACALTRARKHIIGNRIYTERLRPETMPLVSIVVPAYNAEKYLDRCLKSIVSQTYSNLEIIIVDDGSRDSTGSLAEAWAKRDARIIVLHKTNGGLSSARNAGMRIAKGKYIGFVDSDDYVDMSMFGDLAHALECYPKCDLAKCGIAVEYTYEVSDAELKSTQAYFKSPAKGEIRPGFDIINETDVCAVDKLYRLDFLRRNGIEFPEGIKNEDEAFFFAVYCRIRSCYYLPREYYHYLRNEEGIMSRQVQAACLGRLPDAIRVYEFVAELLEREKRLDLLGVLYRHMVGCAQRFRETEISDAVSDAVARILWRTRAFYYADLICGVDRPWVQRRVYELMNRLEKYASASVCIPETWFPRQSARTSPAANQPLVSFIVPVYNVEKYVATTLETLRRQTVPSFEVICIDDGSTDDSGRILDFYARIDSRVKVWHIENGGVSKARNFGIEKAHGKYAAFVDGDDRLHPRMLARTVLVASRENLDAVMFDYRCFAYDSLKPVDHYWRLAKHINKFPANRVFSLRELETLPIYGSSWTYLWNLRFLREVGTRFPDIKLGEDLVWILSTLMKVKRMRVLNAPFYEYRRGNPASAVSRLQTGTCDAPILALKGLATILTECSSSRLWALLIRRMIQDIIFYGEMMPKARVWLNEEGFEKFGGIERLKYFCPCHAKRIDGLMYQKKTDAAVDIDDFIQRAPCQIQKIMRRALVERKGRKKDLIIVAGQLNSTANEPIDSWTFFRWLQEHGVPCRYIVWRKHCMVERMRADNGLKDVILLAGNGVDDFEFIEKCRDLLPRLRAVVMENTALNPLIWRYFHMLDGCSYIFLQHGPTFWKMASKEASAFAVANYVNVASGVEKKFLEEYVPEHWETGRKPQYLIAGLPRWDLLKDESGTEQEKVVFFMPTWRAAFNGGMDKITKSAYFAGIRQLICPENLGRLKKRGLRVVMAAHHHLVNHVKDLDFKLPIDLVPTSEISYWIRHASLCVTDYSSVSFDFLFLDKPCIFWTPDRYDGLLSGDDYSEVVFAEHQAVNMFNRVKAVEDVIKMIEDYADSGFRLEPEKKAVSDRYFSYRSGICRRLYDQICDIDDEEVK